MKTIKAMVYAVLAIGLAACGGGGSSSGGGQFAGNYIGTARTTLTGAGGTIPTANSAVLSVSGTGQVNFSALQGGSGGITCSATPPVVLNGNSFTYSVRYGCNIPSLGACTINESGSGTIAGNTATARATGTIMCPAGTIAYTGTFTGTRQYAKAQSRPSGSTPSIAEAINKAM